MKRKPTFTTSLGSISDPANEDPIGDLAYELRSLLQKCRVDREVRKEHNLLLRCVAESAGLDDAAKRDQLEALVEALEHYAPPYAYFGERENDRGETVYGFWPYNTADIALPKLQAGAYEPHYWGEEALLVNDHGNVECGRFDKRGRWHEYWSCV